MKKQLLIYNLIILSFVFANTYENFELISKDNNSFSIQFNLDQIELEEKNGYTKIIADSKGETSVIGMPKLPKFSTLVMIDPEKEYDITYNVIDSYFIDDIEIIPNQRIVKGLEKLTIDEKDLFYSSSQTYPYHNIILSEPMIMRDIVLSNVSVVPFQYHPTVSIFQFLKNYQQLLQYPYHLF